MPMWHIYSTEGNYSLEDKEAIATHVTDLYEKYIQIPRFYVSVVFYDLPKGGLMIGGKPRDNFTRIWMDHAAHKLESEKVFASWLNIIDVALAPYLRDRGFDYEVHGDETPRAFWSINGMIPPAHGSEDEQRWARDNRSSPLTEPAQA